MTTRPHVGLLPITAFCAVITGFAQQQPGTTADGLNNQRILGVIPNYQTVNDSHGHVAPLTVKQKWDLALRETIDPFNIASSVLSAGLSQIDDDTPKYGRGVAAYGMRFGAAIGDSATQNFFSAAIFATVFHQDPRYFREGEEYSILHRIGYSVTRIVVARQDSGRSAFNASGICGMMLGIGASNLYYPPESVHGSVTFGRIETSIEGGIIGNLMAEFWPDVQKHVLHHHPAAAGD